VSERFDYPKVRATIKREMTLAAICTLMSEGNKNVYNMLVVCAQANPQILLNLDSMNMRGAQIYCAFFGYCAGWMPTFISCTLGQSLEMIDYVNQRVPQMTARRGAREFLRRW